MADSNYSVDSATRLHEIGFEAFTASLITETFDAIIQANLTQTENYLELVKELTKPLTTFVNETKLEIAGEEVLEYLGALPPFQKQDGSPVTDASSTTGQPLQLQSNSEVAPSDINAVNAQFTNPDMISSLMKNAGTSPLTSTLLKDGLGLVDKLVTNATDNKKKDIFPLESHPDFYDSSALDSYIDDEQPAPVAIADASLAKLYDSVAELIAANKYSLLQELVKLGVIRNVVQDGVIRSGLTFHTYERLSESSAQYESHKDSVKTKFKDRHPRYGGIIGLIRGRSISKTKRRTNELRVSTASSADSAVRGTNITITGEIEIRFKTDYLPVVQA